VSEIPAHSVQILRDVREVLRAALFPISPLKEAECVQQAATALETLNLAPEDFGRYLQLELRKWVETGVPSQNLRSVISSALAPNNTMFGQTLSSSYFEIHTSLQSRHKLSHEQATVFLSHAILILRLAYQERMSSAQIARLLSARDSRMAFYWRAVQSFLSGFKINNTAALEPAITQQQVQDLYALDRILEEESFADATPDDAAEQVVQIARRAGVSDDILDWLILLGGDGREIFPPYLQILLFIGSIAEFYDHAMSYPYEFSPRGQAALWLFDQFPAALVEAAANPILNNAKSVDRIDLGWAESKRGGQIAQARALASLLLALEDLSYASKREVAAWVRRWIHRILRSRGDAATLVAVPLLDTTDDLRSIIVRLANVPTQTNGIVEQRILDFLTESLFGGKEWIGRGIGDAVNASNLSRKKLGDVDYQRLSEQKVNAFEAHAGKVSSVYLEGHKRTLLKPLRLRMEDEWRHVSDPSQWSVDVTFIAHEAAPGIFNNITFLQDGVSLRFSTRTYIDLMTEVDKETGLSIELFNRIVVARLNQPYTPQKARNVLVSAIQAVRNGES
jgi:hypothetical protein